MKAPNTGMAKPSGIAAAVLLLLCGFILPSAFAGDGPGVRGQTLAFASGPPLKALPPAGPRPYDPQALAPLTTTTPLPSHTPTPTSTGTVTAEPEVAILEYVQNTHPTWYCQGPFGTPGHRYIRDCYTFQFGTHPARGYVDSYANPGAAEAEWLQRRLFAQGVYPIFRDLSYSGYPAYEAGDENWPYGHLENYFWGSMWVMGATSQDDTHFNRGAGPVTNAVYEAAIALRYLGSPTPTYTTTPTGSPTRCPSCCAAPECTATPGRTITSTHTPTASDTPTRCPGCCAAPQCTTTPTNTPTPCPILFSDVRPSDFFFEPVSYLYCRGMISGYSDNTFRPYNDATRGQVAKIVSLAANWPTYTPPTPTFRDVTPADPFYPYIETAYQHGIISGYICGGSCLEFRPTNKITRGQLAKIIMLAAGFMTPYMPPSPTFRDVPAGHVFFRYIETVYYFSIVSGYNCGSGCLEFRPEANATRGQITKIARNALHQP
jgi:hypothetical protein